MDHERNGADNDSDLSFEALTFGDNGNHNNDHSDKNGARHIQKKKDKFRKKVSTKKETAPHSSSEVYISTHDDKMDVQALLRKLEQFGAVRGYYFKEKQNFGIVQFVEPSIVDVVLENFTSDDLGFHVTVERNTRAKDHHASPHSFGSMPASIPNSVPSTPPPEKPDTILVLKNLPFTLKQDQLHEILLSLSTTIPQSISLHYDNAGVFRGMAFIKYRMLDDAIQVYELLNGMDVGGRKVRVEYKRKSANSAPTTPRQQHIEIPNEWLDDEELRKLWEQLNQFKEDPSQTEWYYPTLTNNQKRNIYNMTEKLKLVQVSSGDGEVKVLYLKKQASPRSEHHVGSVDSKRGGGIDIKARRPRRDTDSNVRLGAAGSPQSDHETSTRVVTTGRSLPRAASANNAVASSAPADMNLDWRSNGVGAGGAHSLSALTPAQHQQTQQLSLVSPVRQPRGPDGSKGFADQYRTGRKLTLPTTCAFLLPATEVAV